MIKVLRRPLESALRSAIGVGDHVGHVAVPGCHRHGERVEDQFGAHVVGHRVAEQPAAAEIEHRRQVQPALPGGDVGDVLAPRDIGCARGERSTDQVGDRVAVGAGQRGPATTPDTAPGHGVQAHQAPHPLDVHHDTTMAEFAMHPRHPVVAVGRVEDLAHQADEFGLGDLTLGRLGRLPGAPVIEPRRRYLDDFARCDDREPGCLLVSDTFVAAHDVDSVTQKASDRLSRSRSIRSCAFSARNWEFSARSSAVTP